jgi:galactokinase
MNLKLLADKFEELYSVKPQAMSSAPGRVNIIGEFTDYNDGFVLPCALEFRTVVLFKTREDNIVNVHSLDYPNESESFSVETKVVSGKSQWGNYIRSIAFVLQRAGYTLQGMDILIDSNVPQGAGLSSSAALEVAVCGAFNHIGGLGLSPQRIAVFGQEAENDFMDCQCGIMDQLISAKGDKGKALLIDCESLETEAISMPDDLNLVIVNSNYPRKLVDSEYNQRRLDCEQAAAKLGVVTLRGANMDMLLKIKEELTVNQFKRAHHVISENSRVIQATEALKRNDIDTLRHLMAASHKSLKHDFEVTVPATDGLVEICQNALGEKGAVRMTGGGFGGAIVCLCRSEDVLKVKSAVDENYEKQFNLKASVYVCKAGQGLEVLSF